MNYRQIYARKAECERKIKSVCPQATHKSGIYCFHRIDEDGFKFAYVGLATKSLLTRLGEHLVGYQRIDLSIKKHGLFSAENPYGYRISILCHCPSSECNEKEKYYIKKAADAGYQLRNVESGGTSGKTDIGERRPAKTYREGLAMGRLNARREVFNWFDKYLSVSIKKPSKNAEKALAKFLEFINFDDSEA